MEAVAPFLLGRRVEWSAVGHESTNCRRAGVDFDPDTAACVSVSASISRVRVSVSVSVAQCKCETRNKFYDVFDGCLHVSCLLVLLTPKRSLFSFPFSGPGAHFRSGKSRITSSCVLPPASCTLHPGWPSAWAALLPARCQRQTRRLRRP